MGFTWAAAWALVGMLIELITELVPGWNGAVIDIWPATLAIPAFIGGMAFSAVLAIAGAGRRFDEMSLPGFAGWGALGGLLVSAIIVTTLGLSPPSLVASGVVTLLCTGSAAGSLALARMAEKRELPDGRGGSRYTRRT
jgi:hypothetical protein